MDLIKIGKYIAGKRKDLGLTQRQLADKLGMSDKSVSKWERGVCLPDVALYSDLCGILGISINEFLAGEDIPQESVVQKSEENIIGVATASKHRQKKLKSVIGILLAVSILALSVIGVMLVNEYWPQNCIYPVNNAKSVEMETVKLLSGPDGALVYDYKTSDKYNTLTIFRYEYVSGKLVSRDTIGSIGYESLGSPKSGKLLFVPDVEHSTVKFISAGSGSLDIPIFTDVDKDEFNMRTMLGLAGNTPIEYDTEMGLFALVCGKERVYTSVIDEYGQSTAPANDYACYFSVEFGK